MDDNSQASFSTDRKEAEVNYVEPPIMGWSSWNTYRVNINEEAAMVHGIDCDDLMEEITTYLQSLA